MTLQARAVCFESGRQQLTLQFREEIFPIKIKSKENPNVYLLLLALFKVEKYAISTDDCRRLL